MGGASVAPHARLAANQDAAYLGPGTAGSRHLDIALAAVLVGQALHSGMAADGAVTRRAQSALRWGRGPMCSPYQEASSAWLRCRRTLVAFRLRSQDKGARDEQHAVIDAYLRALGGVADLPPDRTARTGGQV